MSEHEIDKIAFESKEPDRGFTVRASYLKAPNNGDALVEIFREGRPVRTFYWPAYKIWNIAAHFHDIIEGELRGHDGGYRLAGWNGITQAGEPMPLPEPPERT